MLACMFHVLQPQKTLGAGCFSMHDQISRSPHLVAVALLSRMPADRCKGDLDQNGQ